MSKIKLQGNASGTGTTTIQSANTSSNTTFTIPGTDGSSGQFLITDGSGNLTFSGALGTPTSGTLSSCTVDGTNSVAFINSPQNSQSGSTYTLVLTDGGKSVYFTGGSTATLTVPTNASVAFPTGTTILVLNNNSGALTISGAGVTFQLANGATGNRTVATKGMASLLKVATDTWWVTGPGVT